MESRGEPRSPGRAGTAVGIVSAAVIACISVAATATPTPPDFTREIAPILRRSCAECHGVDRQMGGLRLDRRSSAVAVRRGRAAVVPGHPAVSHLLRRVSLSAGAAGVMPPIGQPLRKDEVALLRRWIEAGAQWPEAAPAGPHWAYVRPVRPDPPAVRQTGWLLNPIDRFVLRRLEQSDLPPSRAAPPATLLRRLSLDLTGLPPSLEDLDRFLSDPSPAAYGREVDRLLASPQFGVKWSRQWLDLARYADSHGFQRDDLRDLWPYRDWVISALNDDMPFDQFTIEQVAGDLLPESTITQQIATGFHRGAPTNVEAGSEPEETRVNQVFDRVNTVAAVWLGSTLECAQCHDHKYDPFSQREYYRLFAFLNNTEIEAERARPDVPSSIRFLGPALELPDPAGEPARKAVQARLRAIARAIDERKKRLDVEGISKAAAKLQLKSLQNRETAARRELASLRPPSTLVIRELPAPRPAHLFQRGDYRSPGEAVTPGAPAALHPLPGGPGNRLTLARWLVDPANPLVGRVMVNRVWMEIWGEGLVRTPEDFGLRGEPPTHPELLDWLATAFTSPGEGEDHTAGLGWSLKRLIRLIVTSRTYRQSSTAEPGRREADPENRLLARGPRVRLDAELIRDQALAAAGLLSLKLGGPPVRPYQPPGLWTKIGGAPVNYEESAGEDRFRRGIYTVWKRGSLYPSFANFDAVPRLACTVRRSRTNTPMQALTLLNDPVYVEAAMALAGRVIRELPDGDTADRIGHAFRLCLARRPSPAEERLLLRLLEAQRVQALIHPERTRALLKQYPCSEKAAPSEAAAWFAVASALLNLGEMITRE